MGEVAARLGVAPATVRSWGRRYGLVPATRTDGGHRRYTEAEVATLHAMQDLVGVGIAPAEAARRVMAGGVGDTSAAAGDLGRGGGTAGDGLDAPPGRPAEGDGGTRRHRRGGPGGQVIAVPGGSAEARGLARAAGRLDAEATGGLLSEMLVHRGAAATWREVLSPVLVAVGHRWSRTGAGVEIEHVLSEAAIDAIRAYCAFLPAPAPRRPVLLACAPEDEHTLPLHILRAALTEQRILVRMLGSKVPLVALDAAARRTGARHVFVWRQIAQESPGREDVAASTVAAGAAKGPHPSGASAVGASAIAAGAGRPGVGPMRPVPADLAAAVRMRSLPPASMVVGGPGWMGASLPVGVRWVHDLPSAVRVLSVR